MKSETSDPINQQLNASAINSLVRTIRLLQEEVWVREWETKNAEWITDSLAPSFSGIERRIIELFNEAKEEIFEDGMENGLTRGLALLLNEYGDDTIDKLIQFLVYQPVNEEVASEVLRWMGRLNHPKSYSERLWLLERSLYNSSARIRDAASVGLASLDDPHAIPYLKEAIQRETYVELCDDMKQVLEQLESTSQCHSS